MSKQIFHIANSQTKKSKLLQRFEKLQFDIATKKNQQENLNDGMRIVIPKINSELHPLLKERMEYQIKKFIRLDKVVEEIVISKTKYLIFETYIMEELEKLLNTSEKNNDILKALFFKYKGEKFQEDRTSQDFILEFVKAKYGIDVDADEIIKKGFDRYMEENQEKFQPYFDRQEPAKKSKKQTKKLKEEEQEEKMLALDAKAIYFRLIKKYHPDRQLDPSKQNEYTEITKLVTKAYKNNDFMALLMLQITYLEENEIEANTLADDMIIRYNKILQAQLIELNKDIDHIKRGSMGMFEDFFDRNYTFSNELFDANIIRIKNEINNLKLDLEYSNLQKKGWFKECLKKMEEKLEHKNLRFQFDSMF